MHFTALVAQHRAVMPSNESTLLRSLMVITLAVIVSAFFLPAVWASGYAGNAYIAIHVLFSGVMLVAWQRQSFSLSELVWIGVVLRFALIFADPVTSNDSERYLWDGVVALSGFDPYVIAPDDPAVGYLREIWPTPVEHARYPTLYPPAAIAILALASAAGPEWGILIWKAILGCAGIASLLIMRSVLSHYGQERHFALVALSPLLVLELGVGAHLDGLLVLAVVIMARAYSRSQWVLLGAVLGWSVCVKFSPILLLVPLFWLLKRADFFRVFVAAYSIIAAIYGTALAMGLTPIGILPTFFEKWRGGSPVFALLDALLEGYPLLAASILSAVFGLALAAFFASRGKGVIACMTALSVPLMVSPVVFPWYLCVLVPLLALRPNWTVLLWVSSVPASYEVLNLWLGAGTWAPASWPLFLIALSWAIGLALDGFSNRGRTAEAALQNTSNVAKGSIG